MGTTTVPRHHGKRPPDLGDEAWAALYLRPCQLSVLKPEFWSPKLTSDRWRLQRYRVDAIALRGAESCTSIAAHLERAGYLVERIESVCTPGREELISMLEGFFGFGQGVITEVLKITFLEFKKLS